MRDACRHSSPDSPEGCLLGSGNAEIFIRQERRGWGVKEAALCPVGLIAVVGLCGWYLLRSNISRLNQRRLAAGKLENQAERARGIVAVSGPGGHSTGQNSLLFPCRWLHAETKRCSRLSECAGWREIPDIPCSFPDRMGKFAEFGQNSKILGTKFLNSLLFSLLQGICKTFLGGRPSNILSTAMRRICYTAAMFLAMGALILPSTLLLLDSHQTISADRPAPCHQDQPTSDAPMGRHHDCCLVGHNHQLPSQIANLRPMQASVALEIAPMVMPALSLARPERALSSFDPPPTDLPLRI